MKGILSSVCRVHLLFIISSECEQIKQTFQLFQMTEGSHVAVSDRPKTIKENIVCLLQFFHLTKGSEIIGHELKRIRFSNKVTNAAEDGPVCLCFCKQLAVFTSEHLFMLTEDLCVCLDDVKAKS